MATVTIDNQEGAVASHSLLGGWDVTRIAVIDGLNPDSTLDTVSLFSTAEYALINDPVNGVGGSGRGTIVQISVAPGVSVPAVLESFNHEALGPHSVRTKIRYKGFPCAITEIDAVLSQIQTNLYPSGAPIVLMYTYPAARTFNFDPIDIGQPRYQGGLVSLDIPELILTVRGVFISMYIGGVLTTPLAQVAAAAAYEGAVNDAAFPMLNFTAAARSVRIDRVRCTTDDGGVTFKVEIVYHYRARTWDEPIVFINPYDGKPPPDVMDNATQPNAHLLVNLRTAMSFAAIPIVTVPN